MNFIDFGYYTDTYGGLLSEEEFDRVLPKAEAYLRGATRGRVRTADTNVCFALCELCDLFTEEMTRRGISAENCDGYSVSYSTPQGFADEAWEIVKIYLLDSGVLYGGTL